MKLTLGRFIVLGIAAIFATPLASLVLVVAYAIMDHSDANTARILAAQSASKDAAEELAMQEARALYACGSK